MKSGTSVEPVGGSGRGRGAVGCLVGAGLFSRGRGRFICSIVSVSGSDFRCREGGFRASSAACLMFVLVSSRAFLSALVHLVFASPRLLVSCCGEVVGSFFVPFVSSGRRCGGGRLSVCLPVFVGAAGVCDITHLVPFMLLACSLRGAGRLGVESSVSSCLLGGGDGVDVRRLVPVPCRAIVCPCRSVRRERERMR